LVVLDIDYEKDLSSDIIEYVRSLDTFTTGSPHSDGIEGHYYLSVDAPVRTKRLAGYDLQGEDALIVGPGSELTDCDHGCCTPFSPGEYVIKNNTEIQEVSREELESVTELDLQPVTPTIEPETTEITDTIGPNELTESGYHPVKSWDSVPHTKHSYFDRKDRIFNQKWYGKEQFMQLYNGEYTSLNLSGSDPVGVGESILAAQLGFWFARNRKIVAYEMENLPHETKYSQNPYHRKSVLDFAESVDWVYCEGVELACKYDIAGILELYSDRTRTVNDIQRISQNPQTGEPWSRKHILNALDIMECEGVVEKNTINHGKHEYTNVGIDESYLNGIMVEKKKLNERY